MSSARSASSRLLLVVAIFVGLLIIATVSFFGLVGWGLATGRVADTKVLPGDKLHPRIVQAISKAADLAPGEQIRYFYSSAITPEGDGNLLTDQRVVSYMNDGTDAWCSSIAVEDIVSVEFIKSDNWIEDSIVTVVSSDGTELVLVVSNEDNGDVQFVNAIRRAAKLDSD